MHSVFEVYDDTVIVHSITDFPHYHAAVTDYKTGRKYFDAYIFKPRKRWLFSGTQTYEHKNTRAQNIIEYNIPIDSSLVLSQTISNIYPLPDGDLIMTCGKALMRISGDRIKWKIPRSVDQSINEICKGNNGKLWICTFNGVYPLDPDHPATFGQDVLLQGEKVTEAIEDFEGNTWFSTADNGIYVLPNRNFSLLSWDHQVKENQIRELLLFKNKLWFFNAAGNTYTIDTTRKLKQVAHSDLARRNYWNIIDGKYIISSTKQVFFDDNDVRTGEKENISGLYAKKYLGIGKGQLLVATFKGIELVDVNSFARVNLYEASEGVFDIARANNVVKGPDGTFWAAGSKGIFAFKYDPAYFFPDKLQPTERLQLPEDHYIDIGAKHPELKLDPDSYNPMYDLAYGGEDE
ncbi:MAG: hypothetical protein AAFR59_16100, partial [Bacteroidota bacterium]